MATTQVERKTEHQKASGRSPRDSKLVTILCVTFSLVLFFGGLLLLGYAFTFEGFEIVTYLGGILCTALGVFSSSTIIKIMDGA